MTAREEQTLLRACGFPIAVDGKIGPRTRQARRDFKRGAPWRFRRSRIMYRRRLRWSAKRGGAVSKRYKYFEFRSKGNGWIKVVRPLVAGLEKFPHKVGILSAYRDPAHNKRVGGSSSSMHMYGAAIDPTPAQNYSQVRKFNHFSGIGSQGVVGGPVRHMDVRGRMSPNFTGGTGLHPTVWRYA